MSVLNLVLNKSPRFWDNPKQGTMLCFEIEGYKKKKRRPIPALYLLRSDLILTITWKMLSSDWLNMSRDIPGSIYSCAGEFTRQKIQTIQNESRLYMFARSFQFFKLGLIRKIHLKNSKVIHRESKYKPQPSIQTKMKIGLSAACDFQLFSRTSLIYGHETCFEFLSLGFENSHCFWSLCYDVL